MSLHKSSCFTTLLLFYCLLFAASAASILSSEDKSQTRNTLSGNNQIQELREPLSIVQPMANMDAEEVMDEDDDGGISEHLQALKRRIGLTMPNILHSYAGREDGRGMHDPMIIQKRRIGLRLPNIIYMRDLDKRMEREWSSDNN